MTSEGKSEIRIEKNWTEDYAVNLAREEAKINAIENAFGSVVSQGNTMYVKDLKTGKMQESATVFNSISNILVNGEWIKTIDEKISFYDKDGYRWVVVGIKGEVRELNKIPFSPEVQTLNCNELNCSTVVFNSGQQLVLYLKSPVSGYVSIFLDDSKNAQRLLPYSSSKGDNTFKVEADKAYFFFSRKSETAIKVDEIELYTSSVMELNKLFILFSAKDFSKPVLSEDKNSNELPPGYTFPMQLSSEKYLQWLQNIRSYNKTIELKTIDITIVQK
jgi:hypothetical protein